MDEQGLDALLATTLENVYYFSGLWSENFIVTPRLAQGYALVARANLGEPTVITGIGDAAAFLESAPRDARVVLYGSFFRYETPGITLNELEQGVKDLVILGEPKKNASEGIVAALKQNGLAKGTIGIDERGVTPGFIDTLRAELPQATFAPADATIRHIRAVKTAEEVERLRAAVRLTEKGILAAMEIAREGVTETEMIRRLEATVSAGGGRPLFTFIYFGRRGALGQLPRGEGVLQRGDVIRFDTGCVLNGYNSDIARNFSVGEPDERARRLYNAMLAGEEAAFQAMRPGVRASEVFEAAVRAVRDAGVPDYQRHHVGHGVGLEVYDVPLLGPSDHTILETGMTFEVETPFYEMGLAGLQPEDTVVLREDGPELLTTLSRELEVVPT
jgi:Xaa-Pro aminopeptidase